MKKYIACSTCRFYPFCRILAKINELDDKDDFIKHDAVATKHERIASICKHFDELKRKANP